MNFKIHPHSSEVLFYTRKLSSSILESSILTCLVPNLGCFARMFEYLQKNVPNENHLFSVMDKGEEKPYKCEQRRMEMLITTGKRQN